MKAPRKQPNKNLPRQPTLLQQLATMPDKLSRGDFRLQYGAICFRRVSGGKDIEILLVTSRGAGRWIIPKGWPMKGKKPHEAAEIEAWEEAGIRGRARKKPVGRYTYLKWLDNDDVAPCVVEVYQVEAISADSDYKERGQRQMAWLSPDEAARRVREVKLKSLLVAFRPRG